MKNNVKNNESTNIVHLGKNNLYCFAFSQNLVETININEYFIKDYDENSEIVFYLKIDLKYLIQLRYNDKKQFRWLRNESPFLPEKMIVNVLSVM